MTSLSVAVHVGLFLLGAWATAGTTPAPVKPPQVEILEPYVQPPSTEPVHSGPRVPAGPTAPTLPVPTVPELPSIPGSEIPIDLPPVDQSLETVIGDIGRITRSVVNGDGRRGSGLGTASVLENTMADKPALPREGNAAPIYPALLRSAGIDGEVDVEFIIDPNGRVRPGSIVIVRADHARFAESVRDALGRSEYYPAEAAGRRVAVRVRQRFEFRLDR